MGGPSVVRVEGPLAPAACGSGADLVEQGYTTSSAEDQLRRAHLSLCLAGSAGSQPRCPSCASPRRRRQILIERMLAGARARC